MTQDAKLRGFVVCGNIAGFARRGPDPDKTYRGTRMFSPGTKVYLGSAYWGVSGESIHVIGLRRVSRKWVNCVINVRVLENLRTTSVYSSATWDRLGRLSAELFRYEDDAEEYLRRCSEAREAALPEMTRSKSRLSQGMESLFGKRGP